MADAGEQLVSKANSTSVVWNYFGYPLNESGNPVEGGHPKCRRCLKEVKNKGGNTTNLFKHLSDRHPNLFVEVKRQHAASREVPAATSTQTSSGSFKQQTTIQKALERGKKYDPKSKEAQELNRAVAEFICLDQVPIYTVSKTGFKNMLSKLNYKYEIPSQKYFMETEIPKLYTETKEIMLKMMSGNTAAYSCTTDLWSSRNMDTYMAVTVQYISGDWEMCSCCLSCVGMFKNHTSEELIETFTEVLSEWNLDIAKMSAVTTDNASNNKKAFDSNTWVPCFGHNLNLAIHRAHDLDQVSAALSQLRKTISAFTRSCKRKTALLNKQNNLGLPKHQLIHDQPTRWNSTYDMVERFMEQQQAISAVLAEDRKSWHLMPRNSDISILETLLGVLSPLSDLTDALSGEKQTTISSVLPVLWKIYTSLSVIDTDRNLAKEMKEAIVADLKKRYESEPLQTVLNCATYLDPRFKNTFVLDTERVKRELLRQVQATGYPSARSVSGQQSSQENLENSDSLAEPDSKKKKHDLKDLLSSIKTQKKMRNTSETSHASSTARSATEQLENEFAFYEKCEEIEAHEDPLYWWKLKSTTFPMLAGFAKRFLCIAASSCSSERVFSTSGFICSPRRNRLTHEHINMLVFLAKNLPLVKNC